MSRTIPLMISLALTVAASSAWANDEQIRADCEYDVQAYGIVDENEYKQALQDCIDSYKEEMQYQEIQNTEQAEFGNMQDTESGQ